MRTVPTSGMRGIAAGVEYAIAYREGGGHVRRQIGGFYRIVDGFELRFDERGVHRRCIQACSSRRCTARPRTAASDWVGYVRLRRRTEFAGIQGRWPAFSILGLSAFYGAALDPFVHLDMAQQHGRVCANADLCIAHGSSGSGLPAQRHVLGFGCLVGNFRRAFNFNAAVGQSEVAVREPCTRAHATPAIAQNVRACLPWLPFLAPSLTPPCR